MSVRVCSGRSLQAAGSSSLYTFLLGPNHWPENELQGMQHSAFQPERQFARKLEGHVSTVYPLVSAVLCHHLNIPHNAKNAHFFLGIIYLSESYPMRFAVCPNYFDFRVESSSPPNHLFYPSPLEDEMPCLFKKTSFSPCFRFIFHVQYFETDDQEFYKTKVCFILNNDVSEMDLVFAEEKYSKSGQLEKVRQQFGKEPPLFIPDAGDPRRSE